MQKTSRALLRAGLAASTIGALMTASFLFAGIASADTTGYQTGYQYTQGLAIGDGAALEAAAMNGTTAAGTGGTAAQSTVAPTTGTGVTTSATAPATTPAVAPATNVAPAAAPAVSTAPAATAGLSQPLTIALWIVIALAAIALIGAVIAGIANANRESTATRTRRSTSYQG